MAKHVFNREMKKGSAELLVLAVLEDGQRHGYEIARQIERRSKGAITFYAASLYPMLYRLEKRGLVTRLRDERDRRMVRAAITESGMQRLRRLDGPIDRVHREQLKHIPRKHLETLRTLAEGLYRREP